MRTAALSRIALGTLLSVTGLHAMAQQGTAAIAGVVAAGTPIEVLHEGLETVEGPIPGADGGLLFTNNRLGRILALAPDGSLSVWFEHPSGPNALTRSSAGDLLATLTEARAIGVVQAGQPPRILASQFEGHPFNRPNDLVADRRGNVYFTDTVGLNATGTPALPSSVYQLTASGELVRITSEIARPNGVALSPDERTLYVANTAGEWVIAFTLDASGRASGRRDFARLALPPAAADATTAPASGADGMAVDAAGRLYVATALGVQVFSPEGAALGTIALPRQPQNLAFAGAQRSLLYVVGRGSVYRIRTTTRGPERDSK